MLFFPYAPTTALYLWFVNFDLIFNYINFNIRKFNEKSKLLQVFRYI